MSTFTGQQIFTLNVAIHHSDHCGIIIHIADDGRNSLKPCTFTPAFSAVSRNDFISTLGARPDDDRDKHTIVPNAPGSVLHPFIIQHPKGVLLEGMQLFQRKLNDAFP